MASSPSIKPHAVAVPLPTQGHINPLMRFCKILSSRGFMITFVNVDAIHHRIAASSDEPNTDLQRPVHSEDENLLRKAHVPLSGLDMANDFRLSLEHLMEALEGLSDALEQLLEQLAEEGRPATCVISDVLVSSVTQKLADKYNIPRISFFPSSQSFNLFWFYMFNGQLSMKEALNVLLKCDRTAEGFHEDLPGLPALRKEDLATFKHIVDDTEYMYPYVVRHCGISYEKAQAMVLNSFDELEIPSLEAIRKHVCLPIYHVGPLIEELTDQGSTSLWKEDNECLQWLEEQPFRSVLYISFGSFTLLSKSQFEEFLSGLEATGRRFLWAFRPDLVEGIADGSILGDSMTRMKDRGYVVTWAPQMRVLSHPSVGGFLTHCGWNSTMEAIASGVPMLCWPYFADQFLITKSVVEEWKIGLRFEARQGGMVGRGEVQRAVNELMEGETLRTNVAQLRDAGRRSLEVGGSSHNNIEAFVQRFSSCDS